MPVKTKKMILLRRVLLKERSKNMKTQKKLSRVNTIAIRTKRGRWWGTCWKSMKDLVAWVEFQKFPHGWNNKGFWFEETGKSGNKVVFYYMKIKNRWPLMPNRFSNPDYKFIHK